MLPENVEVGTAVVGSGRTMKEMTLTQLPKGAVSAGYQYKIRPIIRVLNYSNYATRSRLPTPCYRWTGSGDRPCETPRAPLIYGLAPWLYPNIPPIIFLRYWSWSKGDAHNPYVYNRTSPLSYSFPDNSWVEVVRFAAHTSYVGSDGAGYGLWFWIVPGSGVRVNIGNSIRFVDKRLAVQWSKQVAGNAQLNCTSTGSASCTEHDDIFFCAAARLRGYDSIITRRHFIKMAHLSGQPSDMLELILCPPEEPSEQKTACPSMLAYQTAGGGDCTCNPEGELLSCMESGDRGLLTLDDNYGTRPITTISIFLVTNVGFWVLFIGVCIVLCRRMATRRRKESTQRNKKESDPLLAQVPDTSRMAIYEL